MTAMHKRVCQSCQSHERIQNPLLMLR